MKTDTMPAATGTQDENFAILPVHKSVVVFREYQGTISAPARWGRVGAKGVIMSGKWVFPEQKIPNDTHNKI